MRANNPSSYAQPSKYSLAHNSEAGVETRPAANASWIPKSQIPRPNGPYIPVETLNRYSESYMVIPSNFPDHKSPAKKNHTVVKCRILLLLVRICSWLGAAGLLVCVVLVRPIGSTMDWVIKAPVCSIAVILVNTKV